VTHGELFRLVVTSRDAQRCAVTVQVDTHRKVPSKAAINDVADRLRVPRQQIDHVLKDWSAAQLAEYLSSLTREQLLSRIPVEHDTQRPTDENPATVETEER
jgi:hypothetical protein